MATAARANDHVHRPSGQVFRLTDAGSSVAEDVGVAKLAVGEDRDARERLVLRAKHQVVGERELGRVESAVDHLRVALCRPGHAAVVDKEMRESDGVLGIKRPIAVID